MQARARMIVVWRGGGGRGGVGRKEPPPSPHSARECLSAWIDTLLVSCHGHWPRGCLLLYYYVYYADYPPLAAAKRGNFPYGAPLFSTLTQGTEVGGSSSQDYSPPARPDQDGADTAQCLSR